MAQYDIHHSCGHIEMHQLYGKDSARHEWMRYLGTTLCTDCYRTQQRTKASEAAQASGLPTLTGVSAKQVDYATTVRARMIGDIDEFVTTFDDMCRRAQAANGDPSPAQQQQIDGFYKAVAAIKAQASAAWWLDHKHLQAQQLIQEAM